MIVGCYTMGLYCDKRYEFTTCNRFVRFTGKSETECFRHAKFAGWHIRRTERQAFCPVHAKELVRDAVS